MYEIVDGKCVIFFMICLDQDENMDVQVFEDEGLMFFRW